MIAPLIGLALLLATPLFCVISGIVTELQLVKR